MTQKHRELARAWVAAYHEYRKILPMAVSLDAPDAGERLREHAKADWAAIDRAWERVAAAQRAYRQSYEESEDR